MILSVFECDNAGVCSSIPLTQLSSATNDNLPCGTASVSGLGYTVNNLTHSLAVDVFFEGNAAGIGLSGAVAGYKLQVSPAPLIATYDDVPMSDGAFQFIEAFGAAGITAGCNAPGDPLAYCPDASVTRRQMAVFFAKALGLNWSQ